MFSFYKGSFHLAHLFVFASLLLSGCSLISDKDSQVLVKQNPQQRATQLAQLQTWQIKGKIAFIEKSNRNSASLSWKVNEKQHTQQLNLTTYLGINVLQLDSNEHQHEIQVDGKTYKGSNLEALIYSITGLTLPTQALSFWLKGIAYQKTDIITYQDITQLPETLSSNYNRESWQVSYANYQRIADYNLATKFTIKKNDLLIKIVINDWSVDD